MQESTIQEPQEPQVVVFHVVVLLMSKWKRVALRVFIASCVVAGLSLLMPNYYLATARFMSPNSDGSSAASLLGAASGLASMIGLSSSGGAAETYVGMLQSRSIADTIIDRFDLMTVYDREYRKHVYEDLRKYVQFKLDGDAGIITIVAEDERPQRAADIANAFIEELRKVNEEINLKNAGLERVFLEERLAVVKENLIKAETALESFQREHKTVNIETQSRTVIEAIAALNKELMMNEIELQVLRQTRAPQHPQIRAQEETIKELKDKIQQFENASKGDEAGDLSDIFIPTGTMPELGMQYLRLTREFKLQEKIFELLTQQFELAKIEEAKNAAHIIVIDEAVAPDYKSRPSRAVIVIAFALAMMMWELLRLVVQNWVEHVRDADAERFEEIARVTPKPLRWAFFPGSDGPTGAESPDGTADQSGSPR